MLGLGFPCTVPSFVMSRLLGGGATPSSKMAFPGCVLSFGKRMGRNVAKNPFLGLLKRFCALLLVGSLFLPMCMLAACHARGAPVGPLVCTLVGSNFAFSCSVRL